MHTSSIEELICLELGKLKRHHVIDTQVSLTQLLSTVSKWLTENETSTKAPRETFMLDTVLTWETACSWQYKVV